MLQQLETFCAVAEAGSLNRAAEALHISQPAITRQIKALEAELGAVLLVRTSHGVGLTPAGLAVLPHARQALAALAACRRAAAEASGVKSDRLRVAAGFIISLYTLPEALAHFRQAHPEVEIGLLPGHHQSALDRLLAYEADVALIAYRGEVPGTRSIPLFEDPLVLVGAPGGTSEPCDAACLRAATLLVLPPESGLRQEVDQELARQELRPRLIEQPTVETVKTAAALGMGVTILPFSAVRQEVRSGRLSARPLSGWLNSHRTIRAVVRAEGSVPDHVRSLIRLVREAHGA